MSPRRRYRRYRLRPWCEIQIRAVWECFDCDSPRPRRPKKTKRWNWNSPLLVQEWDCWTRWTKKIALLPLVDCWWRQAGDSVNHRVETSAPLLSLLLLHGGSDCRGCCCGCSAGGDHCDGSWSCYCDWILPTGQSASPRRPLLMLNGDPDDDDDWTSMNPHSSTKARLKIHRPFDADGTRSGDDYHSDCIDCSWQYGDCDRTKKQ